MGQLGGFSLIIHLAIILLSIFLKGFEKLAKAITFYFFGGAERLMFSYPRFFRFLKGNR
jgi:hypothetical protein